MRVLVTGANGFIGSVVVRQLAERGDDVRCLLRPTSSTERLTGLRYEPVPGDVRDEASLTAAIRGCEGVIHLAGVSSWQHMRPSLLQEVVVSGTRNVLSAARATGAPRTVYVSSSVTIGGTTGPVVLDESSTSPLAGERFPYLDAKAVAERLCGDATGSGLPVTIVNPCEVFGPGDTQLVTASSLVGFARSSPVVTCTGGTCIVHVEDVAHGIVAALLRGRAGERYLLGGDNLTITQLAKLTLDLLGLERTIIALPGALARALVRVLAALRIPFPFDPVLVSYASRYWYMDATKARRELGVTFRGARDVLAPTLDWLKAAGHLV